MVAIRTVEQDGTAVDVDHDEELRLVVAVLTFRRTRLLAKLLPQLSGQLDALDEELPGVRSRLLVVDNDPARSAEPIASAAADRRLSYVCETTPGISAARNRALDEGVDDDILVFIDDDELPHDGWLVALVRTFLDSGAGLVAGGVVSEFLSPPDPFVVAGGFYDRAHNIGRPTGSPITRAATNNLLLDLRAVRRLGVRFDADFGRSGGEDGVFTGALTRAGVRGVWCAEAVVTDLVPADRATKDYALRRAATLTQTSVLAELRLRRRRSERVALLLSMLVRETVRLLLGVTQVVRGRLRGSLRDRARGHRAIVRALGSYRGGLGRWPQTYGDG